ncbi:type II secretion system major pseudopilin GspG [Arenimonas sp.]|uniref:type II secretion system major pseudopilin GspG n=1 Tax=Arenimonas sp. TaxID=1872635 RepID=UPI0035B2A268
MRANPNFSRRQRGMSLIELMIVIVLIGGVLALITSRVMGGQDRANVKIAESQLITLAGKVDQYRMDTGRLPDSLDQLVTAPGQSNWLGPYAKAEELKDPWGTAIEFRRPGSAGPYELVSLGADQQAGGESVNADIRKP